MTTIIVTKSSGRLGLTCENHPKRKGALVVGLVEASTAAAAGLRVGDLIVSVNHYPVSTSKECIKHIDQNADVLQLRLACATRKVVLNKAHGCVGIETCRQPTCGVGVEVAMVVDGSPAADAGVCVGDTVLSVNGTLVRSHAQAIELVDAEDIVELVLPNDTRMVEIVKPGSGCASPCSTTRTAAASSSASSCSAASPRRRSRWATSCSPSMTTSCPTTARPSS